MTTKVLALVGEDMDGCSLWRIFQPFTELQRLGFPAEWGWRNDSRLGNIAPYFDAVILPRLHWPPEDREKGDNWFRALHNAGIAVIYEVDDDMFSDDWHRRLQNTHNKNLRKADDIRSGTLHCAQNADGITVSSQRLATIVRSHVGGDKPIQVVPNFIDLRWFRAVQAKGKRQVKGLTIGWAGGIRPDSDVEAMVQAWGRIAERFPHVQFVVQGHQPDVLTEYVPEDRLHRLPWLEIEAYPLGLINIDIGCCPLRDCAFNRAKTYIKGLEFAASGAAVVASPTVYSQLVEHEYDGFIATTADEWEEALTALVQSTNLRRRMAQRLLRKVEREHSLEENVWRWPYAWTEIVSHFKAQPRVIMPTKAQMETLV